MVHYMRVFGRTLRKGEVRIMAIILAVVALLVLNSNIKPPEYQSRMANKASTAALVTQQGRHHA